jgi:plasmid stabilization system protein ParE
VKVVFSEQARAGLIAIGDHIAADNPRRAVSFVQELRQTARALADMPRGFPLVPRYERHGIRRRPYKNYLIFYRIEDDRIVIVHVLHGAQDYESQLFPGD